MIQLIIRSSLIAITLTLFSASCTNRPKDSFEDNVITVNDANLSGFEFSKRLVRKFIEQDIKYPKQEIMTVLKKQIIEDFILQAIFEDFARSENILVKKDLLDEEFNKFKAGYPDTDSFEIFLNESGQTKNTFRDSLKEKILRDLVKTKLFEKQKFEVVTKEIQDYYNTNKSSFQREEQIELKQILFEAEEDGVRIKELLKKTNNKNFETLATKYSLGPEKAVGGDIGWVNVNSYSAFTEAAQTGKGNVTDIIRSENGFHIFKVVDKRKATLLTLKEVEAQISKQLLNQKQADFLNSWIKEKVKTSKVKLNEKLISNISVNRPINL
jgi:parvulin-like peptidyl-prolyl isomerase